MASDKNKPEAADVVVTADPVTETPEAPASSMSSAELFGYLLKEVARLSAKDEKRDAEAAVKSPEEIEREQKKAELKAKIKEQEAYLNEKVTIMLPLIPISGYKEDVIVSINGVNRRIKRGEEVEIERKYANLLTESQKQNKVAIRLMEKESNTYANDERTLSK